MKRVSALALTVAFAALSARAIQMVPSDQVSFPTSATYQVISPTTADAEQALIDLDTQVGANESNITVNAAGIASNLTSITDNTSNIVINTDAIAALSSNGASGLLLTSMITGIEVGYSDADTVAISAGKAYVTDTWYTLATNTTHDMTSLGSGADFHYLYIDYSASTTSVPVIVDATAEPSESTTLGGWYSGDDRCIGVVYGTNSAIFGFAASGDKYVLTNVLTAASAMDPTGLWTTPNVSSGSGLLPVIANHAFVRGVQEDDNTSADNDRYIAVTTKEMADLASGEEGTLGTEPAQLAGPMVYDYDEGVGAKAGSVMCTGWVPLGASRDLRVSAYDAGLDGSVYLYIAGWEIGR